MSDTMLVVALVAGPALVVAVFVVAARFGSGFARQVVHALARYPVDRAEVGPAPAPVPGVRVNDIGDVTIEVPPWTPDESLPGDERAELASFSRDFSRWRAQLWNDLDVAQTITQWEAPR